jgi:hypothetical protein
MCVTPGTVDLSTSTGTVGIDQGPLLTLLACEMRSKTAYMHAAYTFYTKVSPFPSAEPPRCRFPISMLPTIENPTTDEYFL